MARCFINGIGTVSPNDVIVDTDRQSIAAGEPDFRELIPDDEALRRMSRAVRLAVAAGLKCVAQTPPEHIDAIITATGLGLLSDEGQFLSSFLDREGPQERLDPGPFIRSDANTVGMRIAQILHIKGYNVTYSHRGLSFESALADAMLKIGEGARNVLVGAFEEMTDLGFDAQRRLGLYKEFRVCEGAEFLLLGCEPTSTTSCELVGVDSFSACCEEDSLRARTDEFLARFSLSREDVRVEDEIAFKKEYGDGQTHSALMTALAALEIQMGHASRILLESSFANRDHGLILLRQC